MTNVAEVLVYVSETLIFHQLKKNLYSCYVIQKSPISQTGRTNVHCQDFMFPKVLSLIKYVGCIL